MRFAKAALAFLTLLSPANGFSLECEAGLFVDTNFSPTVIHGYAYGTGPEGDTSDTALNDCYTTAQTGATNDLAARAVDAHASCVGGAAGSKLVKGDPVKLNNGPGACRRAGDCYDGSLGGTFYWMCHQAIYKDVICCRPPACGNMICEGEETSTCPTDCGGTGPIEPVCGNAMCEAGEETTCPSDCMTP